MRNVAGLAAALLVLAFVGAAPASGQPPTAAASPADAGAVVASQPAAAVSADTPVPVPTPSEKAMRYYRSGNVLWAVTLLWGFAVPLLLLFTGFSAQLRDLARRIGRKWIFTVAVYGVLFTIVGFVLDLPLAWYGDFVRQHAYGLSEQTAAKWWSDAFKALALACIFNALVPVGALPAAAQEPAALVALHGAARHPAARRAARSSRRSGSSRCSTSSAR